MLWQIGACVIVIDIFYRISVPLDQLFALTQFDDLINNDTTRYPSLHQGQMPNSIIIDEKGVALLIDRLMLHHTPDEGRTWLLSLQKSQNPVPLSPPIAQPLLRPLGFSSEAHSQPIAQPINPPPGSSSHAHSQPIAQRIKPPPGSFSHAHSQPIAQPIKPPPGSSHGSHENGKSTSHHRPLDLMDSPHQHPTQSSYHPPNPNYKREGMLAGEGQYRGQEQGPQGGREEPEFKR